MGSTATRVPDEQPLALDRVESVFDAAVAAAEAAPSAAAAIDAALGVIHDELGGAGASAFVLEHGRLWPVGVRGYAMIPDGLPLDTGVVGRVVRTVETQFVLDTHADPDFVEVRSDVVSELAVPLSTADGMIGLIKQLLDHSQAPTAAGAYTEYPIEKLTVMTNFAVLHKARE